MLKRILASLLSLLLLSFSACGERVDGKVEEEGQTTATLEIATTIGNKETSVDTIKESPSGPTDQNSQYLQYPYDLSGMDADEIYTFLADSFFSITPEFRSDPYEWYELVQTDQYRVDTSYRSSSEFPDKDRGYLRRSVYMDFRGYCHENGKLWDPYMESFVASIDLWPVELESDGSFILGYIEENPKRMPLIGCRIEATIHDEALAKDVFQKFMDEEKELSPVRTKTYWADTNTDKNKTKVYVPRFQLWEYLYPESSREQYVFKLMKDVYEITPDQIVDFSPDLFTPKDSSEDVVLAKLYVFRQDRGDSEDRCELQFYRYWEYPDEITAYDLNDSYTPYDDVLNIYKKNGQ